MNLPTSFILFSPSLTETLPLLAVQAVMSSDFAISRFKHLRKLLLVHGHWCYTRLANMVLYFFYKNVVSFPLQSVQDLGPSWRSAVFTTLSLHPCLDVRQLAVLLPILLWLFWKCHDQLLGPHLLQPPLHLSPSTAVRHPGQGCDCQHPHQVTTTLQVGK